ncbi:hypothetical protein DPMN_047552 [Dreissena polymorpha]|uniref:Uncharacterized protein n=1 Tax=Dreissena polymorpha TaxID=45954 RepID=A0A9D4DBM8_DREPO|nr:hypothetical protein DPMN_047552 [Dreissena polymorpha]
MMDFWNLMFCRVHPLIKEDISGSQMEDIVTLAQDDSGALYQVKPDTKDILQSINRMIRGRSACLCEHLT